MDTNLNSLRVTPKFRRPLWKSPIQGPEDIVDESDYDKRDLIKLLISMRDRIMRNNRSDGILEECKRLYRVDYECKYINNPNNNIPGVHPKVVMIPVAEKDPKVQREKMNFEVVEYLKQKQEPIGISDSRFPCPVILFEGKYICRSKYPPIIKANPDKPRSSEYAEPRRSSIMEISRKRDNAKKLMFAKQDVDFLKSICVSYFIDLSNPEECDFVNNIKSNEGLKNMYGNFEFCVLPYPDGKCFNDSIENIEETTKNYLLQCLQILIRGKGVLIQSFRGCIRTALFTSLLRLSLWADGVIHKNLTMPEIAFLTLGYDWYLFGCRMTENEYSCTKILEFFFDFLPGISTDEFSITRMLEQNQANQESSGVPKFEASRREILKELSCNLRQCYDQSTFYIDQFKNLSP